MYLISFWSLHVFIYLCVQSLFPQVLTMYRKGLLYLLLDVSSGQSAPLETTPGEVS